MNRRPISAAAALSLLAVTVLAVAVFWKYIAEAFFVASSSLIGWRVFRWKYGRALGFTRRRRRRATWPEWIEAVSFAWFAFGFRGAVRPKRDRKLSRPVAAVLPADDPTVLPDDAEIFPVIP